MTDEEKQQALRVARADLQGAYDVFAMNASDRVALSQLSREESFPGLEEAWIASGTLVRKCGENLLEKARRVKELEETP